MVSFGMVQTLLLLVLFVGGMALLPWAVRRWQAQANLNKGVRGAGKVISAIAVGPQQRVVTVEVGPVSARTWLVLGVTAQQIQCLHVCPVPPGEQAPLEPVPSPGLGGRERSSVLVERREPQ